MGVKSSFITAALLILGLVCIDPAMAKKVEGVDFPEKLAIDDKVLTLNGVGIRETGFLKLDVYLAGLYLEQTTSHAMSVIDSSQTKVIKMHFVRDVAAGKLRSGWLDGFRKNASRLSTLKPGIDQLNSVMEDMQPGDEISLYLLPDRVAVSIRGHEKTIIEGRDFVTALLYVWFGNNPPNEGLKQGMLGKL